MKVSTRKRLVRALFIAAGGLVGVASGTLMVTGYIVQGVAVAVIGFGGIYLLLQRAKEIWGKPSKYG